MTFRSGSERVGLLREKLCETGGMARILLSNLLDVLNAREGLLFCNNPTTAKTKRSVLPFIIHGTVTRTPCSPTIFVSSQKHRRDFLGPTPTPPRITAFHLRPHSLPVNSTQYVFSWFEGLDHRPQSVDRGTRKTCRGEVDQGPRCSDPRQHRV
ncbi:hypothetical protein BD414DRAFT_581935 [Trametes punicea]|nr:hypothetical protein BD414DRAFT_581935 [Trametes punicea]